MTLNLSPKRIRNLLLWVVIALVLLAVIGLSLMFLTQKPSETNLIYVAFWLEKEANVPTWFSSALLLAASALLATVTIVKRRAEGDRVFLWGLLSAVFLGMSIDESVSFHEAISRSFGNRLDTGGIFYYPWVVPALVLVALLGVVYYRFLFALPTRTRRLFVVSGSLYVTGALFMEMLAGLIISLHGRGLALLSVSFVEEIVEMVAVVLFIYAILDYLETEVGELLIRIGEPSIWAPLAVAPSPENEEYRPAEDANGSLGTDGPLERHDEPDPDPPS